LKAINCTAEFTPEGQLILPPEIVKRLKMDRITARRIIILDENKSGEKLTDFCGKWQEQRDADEIIAEIYADREKNFRSGKFSL